jgi:hypothetical protein
MTVPSRTREIAFVCIATVLVLAGCGRFGKVPDAVINRQIVLDDPRRGRNNEHLSTEIKEVGPGGSMMTPPVTDADRANGVDARYIVTWKGLTRSENGVASDFSSSGAFTHMSSGEWVTNMGIFDSVGHPALTKEVSGTYRGRYTHYGQYLDCTMTPGAGPDYAGTYQCSGKQWRAGDDATLVPTHFTGTIALFAVFRPDAAPIKLGILDGAFHIIGPNPRRTRALIFASDAKGSWHVAKGVEEKAAALGVGFSGTSGFGSESDTPVFFEKVQRESHAAPPASDTSSAVAPASVVDVSGSGTVVYSDTASHQPNRTSVLVTETAISELPGSPVSESANRRRGAGGDQRLPRRSPGRTRAYDQHPRLSAALRAAGRPAVLRAHRRQAAQSLHA